MPDPSTIQHSANLAVVANLALPDSPLVRTLRGLNAQDLEAELDQIGEQRMSLDVYEQLVRLVLQMTRLANGPNGNTATPLSRKTIEDLTTHNVVMPRRRRWGGSTGRVSTRQAILAVLGEREGIWTKDELVARLKEHGWMPTSKNARNQVTSRLGEMVDRGEVMRHGAGRYSLVSAKTPQGTLLGAETGE